MKKIYILKHLKEINIKDRLEAALIILNERRETDETNISLAFQHRDRIRRVFLSSGLDIDFVCNKLVLKTVVGTFEIKSYNNKPKVSETNNVIKNVQLSLLPPGDKDTILEGSILEICYELDQMRRNYSDLFFQYTVANNSKYSVDLMNIDEIMTTEENTAEDLEYKPKFIKPKADSINRIENHE